MAATPEEALLDAINAAGSLKLKKFRDTMHLPMHQIGMPKGFPPIYLTEEDVPEHRDEGWKKTNPEWVGSSVKIISHKIIVRSESKVAFLMKAARYYSNGELMQTFQAIITVAERDGDWRLISRNPFNIVKVGRN